MRSCIPSACHWLHPVPNYFVTYVVSVQLLTNIEIEAGQICGMFVGAAATHVTVLGKIHVDKDNK